MWEKRRERTVVSWRQKSIHGAKQREPKFSQPSPRRRAVRGWAGTVLGGRASRQEMNSIDKCNSPANTVKLLRNRSRSNDDSGGIKTGSRGAADGRSPSAGSTAGESSGAASGARFDSPIRSAGPAHDGSVSFYVGGVGGRVGETSQPANREFYPR